MLMGSRDGAEASRVFEVEFAQKRQNIIQLSLWNKLQVNDCCGLRPQQIFCSLGCTHLVGCVVVCRIWP